MRKLDPTYTRIMAAQEIGKSHLRHAWRLTFTEQSVLIITFSLVLAAISLPHLGISAVLEQRRPKIIEQLSIAVLLSIFAALVAVIVAMLTHAKAALDALSKSPSVTESSTHRLFYEMSVGNALPIIIAALPFLGFIATILHQAGWMLLALTVITYVVGILFLIYLRMLYVVNGGLDYLLPLAKHRFLVLIDSVRMISNEVGLRLVDTRQKLKFVVLFSSIHLLIIPTILGVLFMVLLRPARAAVWEVIILFMCMAVVMIVMMILASLICGVVNMAMKSKPIKGPDSVIRWLQIYWLTPLLFLFLSLTPDLLRINTAVGIIATFLLLLQCLLLFFTENRFRSLQLAPLILLRMQESHARAQRGHVTRLQEIQRLCNGYNKNYVEE